MIKSTILLVLLVFAVAANAQKIFLDKKDPFTNERMLSTDNIKIVPPLLQAGSYATIGIDKKIFYISFIVAVTIEIKIQTADTVKKECLIKLVNGEVVTGEWKGDAEMPIGSKYYQSSTFLFAEDDYRKLSKGLTTFIKINGVKIAGLYEVKEKQQENLAKLCKVILEAL